MSAEDFFWTWNYSRHKGNHLNVAMAIASYTDEHGVSWPGLDTIAEKARVSRRSVTRLLPELSKDEIVWLEKSAGIYGRSKWTAQSNLYIFIGNRPQPYGQQIQDLWKDLASHTPIYGGSDLNDVSKDKLAILLELIATQGKDRLSTGSGQNGVRGKDKLSKGKDKLATDLFKDKSLKDLSEEIRGYDQKMQTASARDPKITALLGLVLDDPPLVKQADLAFTDLVDIEDGIAKFQLHTPNDRTAKYYQGILDTKAGRQAITYVYGHQVDRVLVE